MKVLLYFQPQNSCNTFVLPAAEQETVALDVKMNSASCSVCYQEDSCNHGQDSDFGFS